MNYLIIATLVLSGVNTAALGYAYFVVIPKFKKGMESLGEAMKGGQG